MFNIFKPAHRVTFHLVNGSKIKIRCKSFTWKYTGERITEYDAVYHWSNFGHRICIPTTSIVALEIR